MAKTRAKSRAEEIEAVSSPLAQPPAALHRPRRRPCARCHSGALRARSPSSPGLVLRRAPLTPRVSPNRTVPQRARRHTVSCAQSGGDFERCQSCLPCGAGALYDGNGTRCNDDGSKCSTAPCQDYVQCTIALGTDAPTSHDSFNGFATAREAPGHEAGVYTQPGDRTASMDTDALHFRSEGSRCPVPGGLWLEEGSDTCYNVETEATTTPTTPTDPRFATRRDRRDKVAPVDTVTVDINEYHYDVAHGGRFGRFDRSTDSAHPEYCAGRPDCTESQAGYREYQSFDGFYNNPTFPSQGAAETIMLRQVPAAFRDGAYHPSSNQLDGGEDTVDLPKDCRGECQGHTSTPARK